MSQVTSPILLDSTGQQIKNDLDVIKTNTGNIVNALNNLSPNAIEYGTSAPSYLPTGSIYIRYQ